MIRRLFQAAAGSTALGGGLGGVASALGFAHPVLDLIASFAPWYGLAAVAGLVAVGRWLPRGRARTRLSMIAAAGLVGAAVICGPELAAALRPSPPPLAGAILRVLQFNVHASNNDPALSAAVAEMAEADVVVVQEAVWRGEAVVERLRASHPHGAPPGLRAHARIIARRPGRHDVLDEDGLQIARFRTTLDDGGPVTVLGVHYVWPEPLFDQARQRRALARVVERHRGETLVIAGDMNLTPWAAAMRAQDRRLAGSGLTRRTRAVASWPASVTRRKLWSPFPLVPIDHVYASEQLETVAVRRLERTGSDHYPVLVVLRRPAP